MHAWYQVYLLLMVYYVYVYVYTLRARRYNSAAPPRSGHVKSKCACSVKFTTCRKRGLASHTPTLVKKKVMQKSMSRGFGNNESKVYVGNLPSDIRSRDLEDIFYKYGKIVDVDLHNRKGPPFAFVEFEDPR